MQKGEGATRLRVLYVEPNEAEVRLLKEAVQAARANLEVESVAGGDAAISLVGELNPAPDVVMVSWYLPGKPALEILKDLQRIPTLQGVPLLIFTSELSDSDLTAVRAENVQCLEKPLNFDGYLQTVRRIELLAEVRKT